MERKNNKGDIMYPKEFQILPAGNLNWENPNIIIHSVCRDSRDGEIYQQQYIEPDRLTVINLIDRGIWTEEEAQTVISLILKAYVLIGEPVGDDGGE